jgi:hypothetical protein
VTQPGGGAGAQAGGVGCAAPGASPPTCSLTPDETRQLPFCRRNSSPCVRVCLRGEPAGATGELGRWVSITLIMLAAWPVLLVRWTLCSAARCAPED